MAKTADPFYKSARWKHLRGVVLRRDGYMCQISRRYGKHVQADTVHHVFPREEFPEYQWQAWNLISLSGEVHNRLHDRVTDALTREGVELLRRVARKHGVDVPLRYREGIRMSNGITLVCGLPGTGKTTWVRKNLECGVAYGLDAIAAAFRLRAPHEEIHDASRRMANDLLEGFVENAGAYCGRVFVIRTAPRLDELERINPCRVVMMMRRYVVRPCGGDAEERLQDIAEWCGAHGVRLDEMM